MAPSILVVDDTRFMRGVLKKMLADEGHRVVAEAGTGIEAVKLYLELKPDLVTMDSVMPEMGGVEAMRKILEADPDARIVMCSGLEHKDQVREALEAGASGFLVKPFSVEQVAGVIRQALSH